MTFTCPIKSRLIRFKMSEGDKKEKKTERVRRTDMFAESRHNYSMSDNDDSGCRLWQSLLSLLGPKCRSSVTRPEEQQAWTVGQMYVSKPQMSAVRRDEDQRLSAGLSPPRRKVVSEAVWINGSNLIIFMRHTGAN